MKYLQFLRFNHTAHATAKLHLSRMKLPVDNNILPLLVSEKRLLATKKSMCC